jgi:hypothetical protein
LQEPQIAADGAKTRKANRRMPGWCQRNLPSRKLAARVQFD